MHRPVTNELRRTNHRPAIANTSEIASLCAPAITAQISSGFRIVSSTERVCRAGLPWASLIMMPQITMNGITHIICSQNTTSCIESPPSTFARYCENDAIGP